MNKTEERLEGTNAVGICFSRCCNSECLGGISSSRGVSKQVSLFHMFSFLGLISSYKVNKNILLRTTHVPTQSE